MNSKSAHSACMKAAVALVAALAVASFFVPAVSAQDADLTARASAAARGTRFLALGIGKSIVVDLPRETKDVLVADPKIANAVVRSAKRAYLIGVAAGQTSVVFFDTDGQQIVSYDIEVGRDAAGVRAALRKMLPNAMLNVDAVGDSVVLSGTVANAADAQQVVEAASRLVGDAKKVVNGLIIMGREQVLLKVTVAEVQRNVLKQLGVDLSGAVAMGSFAIGTPTNPFVVNNPFTVQNQTISNTQVPFVGTLPNAAGSITATLRAMEQSGVLRTLAEPNLTAISGESAKFLAGGEFPVPAGQTCDPTNGCQIQIQFKQFGVGLDFTPVVLSEGRISLRIATEVSELTSEGAIKLASISVPALKVRRANSTVELPSGGSITMAGLLQEQTKQNINGFPGLMNLPVLGALFKSRDFQTGQTELVIIVTPYVVKPVARRELSRPDDGFADPADPATVLLGRINRVYGNPALGDPRRAYHGKVGFIID
ncbi:MAG TPA: type II and III secretion system protein family protein [Xanthobacteraceae bacterium]